MDLTFTGIITHVDELKSGISDRTGNTWKRQQYVIKTEEQYPKHMCFEVVNDNIALFNIRQGDSLTVHYGIDAHEYNGRWFNTITAWKIDREGSQPSAPQNDNDPFAGTSDLGF